MLRFQINSNSNGNSNRKSYSKSNSRGPLIGITSGSSVSGFGLILNKVLLRGTLHTAAEPAVRAAVKN